MALNAAGVDTRIKATAVMTMYDMARVTNNGYFDAADNPEARQAARVAMNNSAQNVLQKANIQQLADSRKNVLKALSFSASTGITTRQNAAIIRAR